MDKKRHMEFKINKLLEIFPAVAVLGPRQCGKSTLVRNLKPDWNYYDLENINDYKLITDDPVSFFIRNETNIIIDEAQQYPEIFKVLRGIIDSKRHIKGRFILTGSSSPEIVKGLTESLAGRIATVELWPFKNSEINEVILSDFYNIIIDGFKDPKTFTSLKPVSTIPDIYKTWLYGGFPEPVIMRRKNIDAYKHWMENYFNDFVGRDIRRLFPKLNLHNFKRFLLLLAHYSGHQINMSNIARSLEVNVSTVKDYLDIIHNTFIWRNLFPFEKNRLKKIQKAPKGFFRDQGLLHHLLKINSIDNLLLHPVAGFSFESFVIEEIIRGFKSSMETQIEFNYYRTIDKSEVDLIVDGPFGIIPIEIKLGSIYKKNSLKGIQNLLKDMNLKLGILVNNAVSIEILADNIIQIPVHFL